MNGLERLSNLNSLGLSSNQIKNIEPLKYLNKLIFLNLQNNIDLEDLSWLENLGSLIKIDYTYNYKTNRIFNMKNMPKIKVISGEHNSRLNDFFKTENFKYSNKISSFLS